MTPAANATMKPLHTPQRISMSEPTSRIMDDDSIRHVPTVLAAIQSDTAAIGFQLASEPKTGSLLRALAASNPIGRAPLRAEPGDVCPLYEARSQAEHFTIWVRARSCGSPCGRRGRTWSRLDYLFRGLPDSIVPLSDKTGPFLDRQVNRFIADAKRCFLITINGGG